jgi:hypothetical protein
LAVAIIDEVLESVLRQLRPSSFIFIYEEKAAPDFSPNPTLELLFAKNARANCSKNASSLAARASNNKDEIVAHPTDHGNAHFEPTQQPANNPAALV